MARRPDDARLPRPLHPAAWWVWAIGMATAASRTTNPLLLALILGVVALVVAARRSDAPWARGFAAYVIAGIVVVFVRVVFRILLGSPGGGHVAFTLPEIPLPLAAAGIRLGGAVTWEGILAAVEDGLRLATLLICLGAANLLANPKRLLAALPGALHELGVAVTVALTFAPQVIESGRRVQRARRLRGGSTRRRKVVSTIVVPVLTDALDRSLALAAAMDSRGYGRTAQVPARTRRAASALLLTGLCGACVGTYGLLDSTVPRALGLPMLGTGVLAALGGLALAGRRIARTTYRPDPWTLDEWAVTVCGLAVATVLVIAGSVAPAALTPPLRPLGWPQLALLPVVGVLLGVLPAWLAPPVERAGARAAAARIEPARSVG